MSEINTADDAALLWLRAAMLAGVRDPSTPDMTMRTLAILLTIEGRRVPPTVRHIAEHLRIPKPGVTRGLDVLESARMVRRQPDPADRRSVLVRVLGPGQSYIAKLVHAAGALGQDVTARASDEAALAAGGDFMERFALFAHTKDDPEAEPAQVIPLAPQHLSEISRLFEGALLEKGGRCRWLRRSKDKVEAIARIISQDLDTARYDWCIDRAP